MKNRSDSPEFGYPDTSHKSEPMLIDDKYMIFHLLDREILQLKVKIEKEATKTLKKLLQNSKKKLNKQLQA